MTQPSPEAITAAKAAQGKWHIPASIQLAQWVLESAWGRKCTGSFNYWGMKALPGQPCATCTTTEFYKGRKVIVQGLFRAFDSAADSFDAHAKLLATGSPYERARAKLPDVNAFANALGGGTPTRPAYATDPDYGSKLIAVIKGSNLTQYDRG